jgi:hypothetical protein
MACDLFFFSSPFTIHSISLSAQPLLNVCSSARWRQRPSIWQPQRSGLLCSSAAFALLVVAVVGAAVAGSAKRGHRWRSSVGVTLVPNPPRFAAVGSRAEERAGNNGRLTVSFALGTLTPPSPHRRTLSRIPCSLGWRVLPRWATVGSHLVSRDFFNLEPRTLRFLVVTAVSPSSYSKPLDVAFFINTFRSDGGDPVVC